MSTVDTLFIWIWNLLLHLCALATSRPRTTATTTSHDVELGVPALSPHPAVAPLNMVNSGATGQAPSHYPPTFGPNSCPLYSHSQNQPPIVARAKEMFQPKQVVLTIQHSNVDSRPEVPVVRPPLGFLLAPSENSFRNRHIKPPTPRKRKTSYPMWFKDPALQSNSPLEQGPFELDPGLVFHHRVFSPKDDSQLEEEDISTSDILPDLDFSLSTISSSSHHSIQLAYAEPSQLAYLQPISPSTSLNVRLDSGLSEAEARESRDLNRLLEILESGCAGKHLSWPRDKHQEHDITQGHIQPGRRQEEEGWTEISLD